MDTRSSRSFAAAARWFAALAASAGGRWDEPGLGTWTVRDLVGHTSRALSTVETYLDAAGRAPDRERSAVDLTSAAEYYVAAAGALADADAVAERGRAAGAALGDDPAAAAAALAERVLARVADAPADARVRTPVGSMTLEAYLPARTVELVVHGCDLAGALDLAPEVPAEPAAEALAVLGALAARTGRAAGVLMALTGRTPLPPGWSLL